MVRLIVKTSVRLKKSCPFKIVWEVAKLEGVINKSYEEAVNEQRKREGKSATFKAGIRSWGTRREDCPLIINFSENGVNYYLNVIVTRIIKSEYQNDSGTVIQPKFLEGHIKPHNSMAFYQGVDKEVMVRDLAISSIQEITINGEKYVLD